MKQYVTHGTGSSQTLSEVQSTNVVVYATKADAEADLSNLAEGQVVATEDSGDELAQPVNEVALNNLHSVTSNAVASMFNVNLNDDSFVNITDQVIASLGVQIVNVRRSNNIVIMKLEGTYTGNPTTVTQQLIRSLPAKYTPRLEQGGLPLFGYNASQIATVSRGSVTADGKVRMSECNWNNGTNIVTTIMYYAD